MEIQYRKGTTLDVKEIIAFVDKAKAVMESQGIFQWDEIYPTEEDFKTDNESDFLYVGKIGDEAAVVFVINELSDEEYKNGSWQYPQKKYCVIHRLCVNPRFQNMGIGTKTMEYILKKVKQEGYEAVRLDAFTENPYSLKMYDKLGFKKVGFADWRKGRFYLMEKYL